MTWKQLHALAFHAGLQIYRPSDRPGTGVTISELNGDAVLSLVACMPSARKADLLTRRLCAKAIEELGR